jgi:hypothetical protein
MTSLLLVPLDDTVVFPTMDVTLPVNVGDEERVLLIPRHENEFAKVGTVAEVTDRVRLPGGGRAVSLSGVACGVAAVMLMARTTTGSSTHGNLYELDAIAAVVIGGTLLVGGRGTIVGTVLGVLIFTTLANVFTLNNLSSSAQQVARGVIIVAAVLLQQRFAGRENRARFGRGALSLGRFGPGGPAGAPSGGAAAPGAPAGTPSGTADPAEDPPAGTPRT